MRKLKVKVCGLTRTRDAKLVSQLGADMIGLIFYRRSPRFVSQSLARELASAVDPTVARVGVFVDEEVSRMLRLAAAVPLDYIQLHGSESNRTARRLQKEGHRVIKAFSGGDSDLRKKLATSKADLLLLDNVSPKARGGTGQPFDWTARPPAVSRNIVLSGGIDARNVKEGIRRFNPLMVDINSGVETSPGIKSAKKLKEFFALVDKLRYGQKA